MISTGRRSQGDSPLTASPLARRVAEDSPIISRDNSSNSISTDTDFKRGNKEKRISNSSIEDDKPTAPVKLRTTGLADSLRSPTNGFPRGATSEIPKSPILKTLKDASGKYFEWKSIRNVAYFFYLGKPAPPTAPKPRPWSMTSSDRKSGEFSLTSDGSSPVTSAGNTPDSGDALDEADMNDRRSVRDMAAGINKTTAGDTKRNTGLN